MEVQVTKHEDTMETLTMQMVDNYWKNRKQKGTYTQTDCIEGILRLRAEYGLNSFFGYRNDVRMPRLSDVIFKLKRYQMGLKKPEYEILSQRKKDGSTKYILRPSR